MSQRVMRLDAASCRLCGAKYARKRPESIGCVCETCWRAFMKLSTKKSEVSENEFNRWFARQLMLSASRMERYGMATRCEAATLTFSNKKYLPAGHQCGHWATMRRDGRPVCARHGRANYITFVGTKAHSSYALLEAALVRLSKDDPEFCEMLNSAARASAANS